MNVRHLLTLIYSHLIPVLLENFCESNLDCKDMKRFSIWPAWHYLYKSWVREYSSIKGIAVSHPKVHGRLFLPPTVPGSLLPFPENNEWVCEEEMWYNCVATEIHEQMGIHCSAVLQNSQECMEIQSPAAQELAPWMICPSGTKYITS